MLTKHIENYVHDYRDLAMNEVHLEGMLISFKNEILKDLLAIADSGEFENMRRECEEYFKIK